MCGQNGTFLTSVGSYVLNLDKRNDPMKPTRGFDATLRQDFAGIGGQVHYLRSEVEGTVYRGLAKDVRASLSPGGGYVFGRNDDSVRINDRFSKGGQSFRGFDVAGIGPRQLIKSVDSANPANPVTTISKGNSLGGNAYAIGSAQLEIPLFLPKEFNLSGALFTDFGTLGVLDDKYRTTTVTTSGTTQYTSYVDDALTFRASAGISIFWESPFGPVQFDFADPFKKGPYDTKF